MPRRSRDAAFYARAYLVLAAVYTVFTKAGAGYILSGVGRLGLYRHEPEYVHTGGAGYAHWWEWPMWVAILLGLTGVANLVYIFWPSRSDGTGAPRDSDGDGVPDFEDDDPYDPHVPNV